MSDLEKIKLPDGFIRQAFLSIDSTNKEAARKIAGGTKGGLWITAEEQTGGRGRGGREWVSKPGNLYCSLVHEVGDDIYQAAQLSFVASLAVRDSLGEFLNIFDIGCKWPNDVLVNNKKISGILLETCTNKDTNKNFIIIGIGINIAHHPDLTLYEATHLNEHLQSDFESDDVFAILVQRMAYWLDVWQNLGFSSIRQSWLDCSRGLGEIITVKLPDQQLIGRFVDLDAAGALKLEVDKEIKLIHSGDVFFTS